MKRIFTRDGKKAVCFDLNRTLLDPDASLHAAFTDVLEQMTGRWDGDNKPDPEHVYAAYAAEWKKKSALRAKSAAAKEKWRQQCLAAAFAPFGLPVGAAALRSFFRKVKERQEQLPRAYPHVVETVGRLAEHYRIAVISNGSREKQLQSLEQLKLTDFIKEQHLFSSSDWGVRKPHPTVFRKALEALKVPPGQAVMVGNSWKSDVIGAVGAGMDAVWLHPGHGKKSSQRKVGSRKIVIIRKFGQLLDIFEL